MYNKTKRFNNNKDVEKNVIATPEELNENIEINIKEKDRVFSRTNLTIKKW